MNRNVQALRALAVYAVVAHHVINALNHYFGYCNIQVEVGATGVDVFFVISGFIMAVTTSHRSITPSEFIKHRIVRIVPLYWLLTLISAGLMLVGFRVLFNNVFDMGQLIRSLLFIGDPDTKPILFVGWTLNFEMMFYAIFAVCLFVSELRIRLGAICGAIVLFWLIGLFVPRGSYIGYMASDVILEFAAGIGLWALGRKYTLSLPVAFALLICGLCGLAIPDLLPQLPSKTLALLPAACALVFAAISLEAHGISVGEGMVKRQGDASYSIYLVHPFVLQAVGKVAILVGLTTSDTGMAVTIVALFAASGIAGTAFYRLAERPLTARLRDWTSGRSAALPASALPRTVR